MGTVSTLSACPPRVLPAAKLQENEIFLENSVYGCLVCTGLLEKVPGKFPDQIIDPGGFLDLIDDNHGIRIIYKGVIILIIKVFPACLVPDTSRVRRFCCFQSSKFL